MSFAIDHAPDPRLQSGAFSADYPPSSTADTSAKPSRRERSDGDENPDAKRAKVADFEGQQLGAGAPDQNGNHPDGRQEIRTLQRMYFWTFCCFFRVVLWPVTMTMILHIIAGRVLTVAT